MATRSRLLGGGILLLAGLYQWLPLKGACLSHCRSPLGFFTAEWREGVPGALVMGVRHESYCVGCCWALMALLFVAGVMNLFWVVAIAGFVLAEKVLPNGRLLGRMAGALLAGWGLWMVVLYGTNRS
jgi:predicted metal-binding membrane protein